MLVWVALGMLNGCREGMFASKGLPATVKTVRRHAEGCKSFEDLVGQAPVALDQVRGGAGEGLIWDDGMRIAGGGGGCARIGHMGPRTSRLRVGSRRPFLPRLETPFALCISFASIPLLARDGIFPSVSGACPKHLRCSFSAAGSSNILSDGCRRGGIKEMRVLRICVVLVFCVWPPGVHDSPAFSDDALRRS